MPEEIAKIINKYGDYMEVLKNGAQEERDKISHGINDLITAEQKKRECDFKNLDQE